MARSDSTVTATARATSVIDRDRDSRERNFDLRDVFLDCVQAASRDRERSRARDTIDCRLKPLLERFGDTPTTDVRTADEGRKLTPASINRTTGLLRHMLNWAVGREYLDRTPFRRGTEVPIRVEREDNKPRRRMSEEEEAALLAVASPHLRSMIIAVLDTDMRRGEMLVSSSETSIGNAD